MKRAKLLIIATFVFSMLVVAPSLAAARFHLSWYLGAAFPQDIDVILRAPTFGGDTATSRFDPSFTTGVRVGYWFTDSEWIGLALDGSLAIPHASEIDLDIVPVSLLLMFKYPHWRVQPYFGVGPGIFFTHIDTDTTLGDISAYSTDFGVDTRLGLTTDLDLHFSMFLEYSFKYFEQGLENSGTLLGVPVNVEVDGDMMVHHIVLGVTYRF